MDRLLSLHGLQFPYRQIGNYYLCPPWLTRGGIRGPAFTENLPRARCVPRDLHNHIILSSKCFSHSTNKETPVQGHRTRKFRFVRGMRRWVGKSSGTVRARSTDDQRDLYYCLWGSVLILFSITTPRSIHCPRAAPPRERDAFLLIQVKVPYGLAAALQGDHQIQVKSLNSIPGVDSSARRR